MSVIESLEKYSEQTIFVDQKSMIVDDEKSYRSKFILIKDEAGFKIVTTDESWVKDFHAYIAYCYFHKMKLEKLLILGGGVISFSGSDEENEHLSPVGTIWIESKSIAFGDLPYQIRTMEYPKKVIFSNKNYIPADPNHPFKPKIYTKEMLCRKAHETLI